MYLEHGTGKFLTSPLPARDVNLPARAKAVYYYLSSYGKRIATTAAGIASGTGMGRGTVVSALIDLNEAGYITREQIRDEAGRYQRTVYTLIDPSEDWGVVK